MDGSAGTENDLGGHIRAELGFQCGGDVDLGENAEPLRGERLPDPLDDGVVGMIESDRECVAHRLPAC
jgi:hypothetical protein